MGFVSFGPDDGKLKRILRWRFHDPENPPEQVSMKAAPRGEKFWLFIKRP
jgi:hypothetical protein